jgi:UDP-3-O-[3-hydroxymyristoyl] glucosamine N-acyltransferase
MRLSEIDQLAKVELVRDGEFDNLGLLSHGGTRVLAAFYDNRFANLLTQNPDLSCVITSAALAAEVPEHLGLAIADDVKTEFYGLHENLVRHGEFYWKDFKTEIAADARIHKSAYVAPINVRIGNRTIVGPRAVVLERSIIGSDCTIHSGAVIGGEGFEPKWIAGRHLLIPHAGGVKLGNSVEILCGTHVACAVFGGVTEIGEGTKIDALVHIAHNSRIGSNCEIAANAFVGGSATVGDGVWIGPNACVSSEVRVGNRAFITLGSVVIHEVHEEEHVSGYFAFNHREYKRAYKLFRESKPATSDYGL